MLPDTASHIIISVISKGGKVHRIRIAANRSAFLSSIPIVWFKQQ